MKLLLSTFLIITINNCVSQQTSTITEISYEAITRGSYIIINVSKLQLEYKDNNTQKTIKINTESWNNLITLCSKFDLEKLEDFNPLNNKHATDAALHATITVKTIDKEYISQTFDHGNPPEELKQLVEKLLALAEIEN